jgi:hypothetical protein
LSWISSVHKSFQGFLGYIAFVVGVVAGVAQLAGFSTGLGRWVLTMVAISCLLFLVIRFSLLYYVKRDGELKRELDEANQRVATMQVGYQRYVDAIDRIIDQEGPIYQESLEITVIIGRDDEGDTIVERRTTVPKPRVTHRAIRPVVPDANGHVVTVDDIALTCSLEQGANTITVLPLTTNGKPRIWLVFDPGLTETFSWIVKYRPCALWSPLRKRGFDYLVWNDRLPAGIKGNSILSELSVKFVFPNSMTAPTVVERHDFGESVPAVRQTDGDGWLVAWHDSHPAGHRYEWDLAQAVRGPT